MAILWTDRTANHNSVSRLLHTKARPSTVRYGRVRRRRVLYSPAQSVPRTRARKGRRRPWPRRRPRRHIAPARAPRKPRCPARYTNNARARGGLRLETSPSPVAPTESSSSVQPSSAPNPQAIKVVAIPLFITTFRTMWLCARFASDHSYVIAWLWPFLNVSKWFSIR